VLLELRLRKFILCPFSPSCHLTFLPSTLPQTCAGDSNDGTGLVVPFKLVLNGMENKLGLKLGSISLAYQIPSSYVVDRSS
jgi:hypothetical protein